MVNLVSAGHQSQALIAPLVIESNFRFLYGCLKYWKKEATREVKKNNLLGMQFCDQMIKFTVEQIRNEKSLIKDF